MDGCARTIEWLRERVPVEMIREISLADYGEEAEDHFAGIMDLLERQTWVNGAPQWCPREVLVLDQYTAETRENGHLRRIFLCTLLVACMGYEREEEFFIESNVSALIRLTGSAMVLGGEAPALALEVLTWFAEQHKRPQVYPFTCFCIALLRTHLGDGDAAALRAWVEEEERRAATSMKLQGDDWLVRLNGYTLNDPLRAKWAWAS